jgi:hypothetical protein
MLVDAPGLSLVPYGVTRWALKDVQALAGPRLRLGTGFPAVLIDRSDGDPRRFNNTDYDLQTMPQAQGSDLFVAVREHTRNLCVQWDRFSNDFVDGYFSAVERVVEQSAGKIQEDTGFRPGLYALRDWVFSAWRPFPRAHLRAPNETPANDERDWVQVDFAFWNGMRFVAVDMSIRQLLPKHGRRIRARLGAAGIGLVDVVPSGDGEWDAFLRRISASSSLRFWSGQRLPMGPFRSTAFEALEEACTS